MEYKLPPIRVDEVLDHAPLAEQYPGFHTMRGDAAQRNRMMERGGDGEGIIVGVGDTGVDKTHQQSDLSGVTEMKDFTRSRYGVWDRHFHGSHCLGHIGARDNGGGIAGLAPKCNQLSAKVLGDNGSGSSAGIASGIHWMADKGAKIINLSLGGGFSQTIENACKEVAQQGVLVFAAMGNSGNRGSGHPGNSRYTLGICAVDWNLRLANFSSRGDAAMYSGFGVQVLSCGLNGSYVRSSGTSMATPDQAGICAKILGRMTRLGLPLPKTMEEYHQLCVDADSIQDLGTDGRDRGYGFGFIHVDRVLDHLDMQVPNPDPGSPTDPTPPETGEIQFGVVATSDGLKILHDGGDEPAKLVVGEKTYTGRG